MSQELFSSWFLQFDHTGGGVFKDNKKLHILYVKIWRVYTIIANGRNFYQKPNDKLLTNMIYLSQDKSL